MFDISAYADLMREAAKEKSATSGSAATDITTGLQEVSFDATKRGFTKFFQDVGSASLFTASQDGRPPAPGLYILQSARMRAGITLSDLTKFNFTISLPSVPQSSTSQAGQGSALKENKNWPVSQSLSFDLVANPDVFTGTTEENVISINFWRSEGNLANPCFIDLIQKHGAGGRQTEVIKSSNLINFCYQWKLGEEGGLHDYIYIDQQEVGTFQSSLAVQVGIVPIVRGNHTQALQIAIQVNGLEVISEVISQEKLGVIKNRLYYPKISSEQVIGPAAQKDENDSQQSAGQSEELQRADFSRMSLSEFNIYKATPVFVEGTVTAASFTGLKTHMQENEETNNFIIFFKLYDACKQPTTALVYPTQSDIQNADIKRAEDAGDSWSSNLNFNISTRITVLPMSNKNQNRPSGEVTASQGTDAGDLVLAEHCRPKIPEQDVYDTLTSRVKDDNAYFVQIICARCERCAKYQADVATGRAAASSSSSPQQKNVITEQIALESSFEIIYIHFELQQAPSEGSTGNSVAKGAQSEDNVPHTNDEHGAASDSTAGHSGRPSSTLLRQLPAPLQIHNSESLATTTKRMAAAEVHRQGSSTSKNKAQQTHAPLPQLVEEQFILVIDGSDADSGYLLNPAITNDEYHFRVRTFQPLISAQDREESEYYQNFLQQPTKPVLDGAKKISPWLLDIKIFSDVIHHNFSSNGTSTQVNFKCVLYESKQPCVEASTKSVSSLQDKHSDYEISFVPTTNGTYTIVSEHFLANHNFHIKVWPQAHHADISQSRQISTLFSNAAVRKSLTGAQVTHINVGEKIEIHLELRNHGNELLPAPVLSRLYQECNLHHESYFTVAGQRYQFQSYSNNEMEQATGSTEFLEGLALSVMIYKAGVAQFNIILSCPNQNQNYKIGCGGPNSAENNQCQLQISPKDVFESIKVQVPLFPSNEERLLDPVDKSLTYFIGENLVFDLILNDIYENKLNKEVSPDGFTAKFKYGPPSTTSSTSTSEKADLDFEKIQQFGIISFTTNATSNTAFKALPPRAGNEYYSIVLTYTTPETVLDGKDQLNSKKVAAADSCATQKTLTIPVKLVSTDWMEPFNYLVTKWDSKAVSNALSTVQYDNMIRADRPGRIYIILRNQKFQQINEWPESLDDELEIKIYQWMHEEERKQKEAAKNNTKSGNKTADASKSAKASEPAASKKPTTPSPATPSTAKGTNTTLTYSWVAVDDMCQIQKSRGLYPGEFMAWFNCTASQTRLAFSVLHKSNKADKGTTILPDKRTFYVTEGSRFQVKFEEKIAKKIKESSKQPNSNSVSGIIIDSHEYEYTMEPTNTKKVADSSKESGSAGSPTDPGAKKAVNRGLNLKFNITDAYGNNVDTILLVRNNPDLGQMTYKLTKSIPKVPASTTGAAKSSDQQKSKPDVSSNQVFVSRGNIIFLGRQEPFNCQIFINELEVGDYYLTLEIPSDQDLRVPIKVISSSQTLSMNQKYLDFEKSGLALKIGEGERLKSYTLAYRVECEDGCVKGVFTRADDASGKQKVQQQPANGSSDVINELASFTKGAYVTLIVEPRNIYNNAYNFTSTALTKLASQISAVAINLDTGDSFNLQCKVAESENVSKAGQPDAVSGQKPSPVALKMLYASEVALNKGGRYTLQASFTDLTQGQLYLSGSSFRIAPDEEAEAKSTDLYLTKGPQKSATSTYQRLLHYPTFKSVKYSPTAGYKGIVYSQTSTCGATQEKKTQALSEEIEPELRARATIPAQHYDARFDSVLMFKAWLKDEFGDQFTRASKNANFAVSLSPIQLQYSAENTSSDEAPSTPNAKCPQNGAAQKDQNFQTDASIACVARLVRMPWQAPVEADYVTANQQCFERLNQPDNQDQNSKLYGAFSYSVGESRSQKKKENNNDHVEKRCQKSRRSRESTSNSGEDASDEERLAEAEKRAGVLCSSPKFAWHYHEDSGELTIFPADDAEQSKISNDLKPGYYAVEILMLVPPGDPEGASSQQQAPDDSHLKDWQKDQCQEAFGSAEGTCKPLGPWTLSISNSRNPDPSPILPEPKQAGADDSRQADEAIDAGGLSTTTGRHKNLQQYLNLFAPSDLVVEAGKPFTFNVEVSGSTKARAGSCSLESVVEQDMAAKRKAVPKANDETKTAAGRPAQVSGPSCPELVATWKRNDCGAAEDKELQIVKIEQLAPLTARSQVVPCTSSQTGSSAAESDCRDLTANPYLGIKAQGACKKGEGCPIASEVGGRMNYISLYEQRAGIYKITLRASWPLGAEEEPASATNTGESNAKAEVEKEVIVTVLPSWLESIPLEENAAITPQSKGTPTGAPAAKSTSIKVNEVQMIRYSLKDYFGNTIQPSSLQSSQTASKAQASGPVSNEKIAALLAVNWTSAFDSWDRDVDATYTEEFVNDLITIRHEHVQHPIIKQTKRSDDGFYETYFTTQNEGAVLIESPFFEEGRSYGLTFATDYTVQPSLQRSFVQLENSTLSSSNTLKIRAYMFDKVGNPLLDQIQPDNSDSRLASELQEQVGGFALQTNIVPAASCNASTQVKDMFMKSQQIKTDASGSYYQITLDMFAPCIYKVKVYFIQNNVSTQMLCSSCDLTVTAEDTRSLALEHTQFFDLLKKQKVSYQQPVSERVIRIMQKQEQIIIPFYFLDEQLNLKFDTIEELNEQVSKASTEEQQQSSKANLDSGSAQEQPKALEEQKQRLSVTITDPEEESKICVKSEKIHIELKSSALHFISFKWADQETENGQGCLTKPGKGKLVFSSQYNDDPLHIYLEVVDDQISQNALDFGIAQPPFGNKINATNSLVSYLNQNSNNFIEPVNLPTIDQYCFQGKKLPLVGIIDIRNDLGLRQNLSLAEGKQIISIDMPKFLENQKYLDEQQGAKAKSSSSTPPSYDFEIYSGPEGNGTFLFTLLVDETSQAGTSTSPAAYIMLNNVSLSQFPIHLNCQRNLQIVNDLAEVNGERVDFDNDTVAARTWDEQQTTTKDGQKRIVLRRRDPLRAGERISLTLKSFAGDREVENIMQDIVIQPVAQKTKSTNSQGQTVETASIPNIAAVPSQIVKKAPIFPVSSTSSASSALSTLTYIFDTGVPKDGTYNIILANRLTDDKISYEIEVVQQPIISPTKSWFEVSVPKSSRVAGNGTIVIIHPRDEYGNVILAKDLSMKTDTTATTGQKNPGYYNDDFKVQYAKARHGTGLTAVKNRKYGHFDFYRTLDAEACRLVNITAPLPRSATDDNTHEDAGIIESIISCEVNLTLLGQYQFRVIKQAKPNCVAKADNTGKDAKGQNGNQDNRAKQSQCQVEEIKAANRFALVTELAFVDLAQTLLLAMPFNLYEADQDPTFGMSPHLMPVVTEHWLTYKVILRDKFGNALLRKYDYQPMVYPLQAQLRNAALDGGFIATKKTVNGKTVETKDHRFTWEPFQIESIQLFVAHNATVQSHIIRNQVLLQGAGPQLPEYLPSASAVRMQIGVGQHTLDVKLFLRCSLVERDDTPDSLELRYGSSVQPKSRGARVGAAPSTGRQLAQRADDASVLLLEIVTSAYKWTPLNQYSLNITISSLTELQRTLTCVSSGGNAGTCQLGGGRCDTPRDAAKGTIGRDQLSAGQNRSSRTASIQNDALEGGVEGSDQQNTKSYDALAMDDLHQSSDEAKEPRFTKEASHSLTTPCHQAYVIGPFMENFALAYLKVQNANQTIQNSATTDGGLQERDGLTTDPQFYSTNTLQFTLVPSSPQYAEALAAGELELIVQPSLAMSAIYDASNFQQIKVAIQDKFGNAVEPSSKLTTFTQMLVYDTQRINARPIADLSRKAFILEGLAITNDSQFVEQSKIINTLGQSITIKIADDKDASLARVDPDNSFFSVGRDEVIAGKEYVQSGDRIRIDVHLRNKFNKAVELAANDSTSVLVQIVHAQASLTGQSPPTQSILQFATTQAKAKKKKVKFGTIQHGNQQQFVPQIPNSDASSAQVTSPSLMATDNDQPAKSSVGLSTPPSELKQDSATSIPGVQFFLYHQLLEVGEHQIMVILDSDNDQANGQILRYGESVNRMFANIYVKYAVALQEDGQQQDEDWKQRNEDININFQIVSKYLVSQTNKQLEASVQNPLRLWQGQRLVFFLSLSDQFGNQIYDAIGNIINDVGGVNKISSTNGVSWVNLEGFQYAMLAQIHNESDWQRFKRILPGQYYKQNINLDLDVGGGEKDGTGGSGSTIKSAANYQQLKNLTLDLQILSINPQQMFMTSVLDLQGPELTQNIAAFQNFTIADTTLFFENNIAKTTSLQTMKPSSLELNAASGQKEVRYVSILRSKASLQEQAQISGLTIDADAIQMPYLAEDIETYSIEPRDFQGNSGWMQTIRIANNGRFRLVTNLTKLNLAPSSGSQIATGEGKLYQTMTLTLRTADPAGGETMSFKDIKVYGHERTAPANKISMRNLAFDSTSEYSLNNNRITELLMASEEQSFSSSIELEFNLSSSSGQLYPFDKFYTDRIMIVRNRFETVQPNHYSLTKGFSNSTVYQKLYPQPEGAKPFDTYKLKLYLSGMNGDTQSLELYYHDGDYRDVEGSTAGGEVGLLFSLFETDLLYFKMPSAAVKEDTSTGTAEGDVDALTTNMSKAPQPQLPTDGQHVAVASNLLTQVPSGLQSLKQVPQVGSPDPKALKTSNAGSTDDLPLKQLELVIKLQEPHASLQQSSNSSSPSAATLTILHNFDFKILAMLVLYNDSSEAKTCTNYTMQKDLLEVQVAGLELLMGKEQINYPLSACESYVQINFYANQFEVGQEYQINISYQDQHELRAQKQQTRDIKIAVRESKVRKLNLKETVIYSDLKFQKELAKETLLPVKDTLFFYIFNPDFYLYHNQIDINFKFLNGELVAGGDFDFTYNFDENQSLYSMALKFYTQGQFTLAGLTINSQQSGKFKDYRITVTEAECYSLELLKAPAKNFVIGQNLTMIFRCLGVDNEPIEIQDPEKSLKYIMVASKQLQAFYTGKINEIENPDSPKYGQLFILQETLLLEGTFSLTINHQNSLMPQGRAIYQSWDDITVTGGACTDSSQVRCPQNFAICADSFIECQMISESCYGQDLAKPFRCLGVLKDGVSIAPAPAISCTRKGKSQSHPTAADAGWQCICVAKIDDCCGQAASKPAGQSKWCEGEQVCMHPTNGNTSPPSDATNTGNGDTSHSAPSCCEWTAKQIRCRDDGSGSTSAPTCVANQYECCADLTFDLEPPRLGSDGAGATKATKPMVKCTYEDKCVPENTSEYCFEPFERDCVGEQASSTKPEQSPATTNSIATTTAATTTTTPEVQANSGWCPKDGRCYTPTQSSLPTSSKDDAVQSATSSGAASKSKLSQAQQQPQLQTTKDKNCTCLSAESECNSYKSLHCQRCPQPRVCPPGYTQCPDLSCIPGVNRFGACKTQKLQSCERMLPDNSIVKFIRCPGDGNSCAASYEDCPSLITCPSADLVVCPDGTCQQTQIRCLSHTDFRFNSLISLVDYRCNEATPVQCPGLQVLNICARDLSECPTASVVSAIQQKSCPSSYFLCESGECSLECQQQQDKPPLSASQPNNVDNNIETGIQAQSQSAAKDLELHLNQLGHQTSSYSSEDYYQHPASLCQQHFENGIPYLKCPQSNECRLRLEDCPTTKLCATNWRFSFGPVSKILCPSLQNCVDHKSECHNSFCQAAFNIDYDKGFTKSNYRTCPDGRCAILPNPSTEWQGIIEQAFDACMTPFSCSAGFNKVDTSVGEFCVNSASQQDTTSNLLNQVNFLAHALNQYECPINFVKCLQGNCVVDISMCATDITCPIRSHPVRCQDGQCVKSSQFCKHVDIQVQANLAACIEQGLLLCQSDLLTCTTSLAFCPSPQSLPSSCAAGETKCWNGNCINHLAGESCSPLDSLAYSSCAPSTQDIRWIANKEEADLVRCPLTAVCVLDLSHCELSSSKTINQYLPETVPPPDASIIACKYWCGSSCSDKPCESWRRCENTKNIDSFKCWDGQCVSDLKFCKRKAKECSAPNSTSAHAGDSDNDNCVPEHAAVCIGLYPNFVEGFRQPSSDCFVPQCPPKKPHKCPGGLCVSHKKYCAASPFSKARIGRCQESAKSQPTRFGEVNRFVPCGDGTCVSEASQCLPLMDCEDVHPKFRVRCSNDGACVEKEADCVQPDTALANDDDVTSKINNQLDTTKQVITPLKDQKCPSHVPCCGNGDDDNYTFMCQTGQCARTGDECLLSHNGCEFQKPYKCQFSGLCVSDMKDCSVIPLEYQAREQIYSSSSNHSSQNQFVELYDQLKNICELQGLYFCIINQNMRQFECVSSLTLCLDHNTGCPVNYPIKCGVDIEIEKIKKMNKKEKETYLAQVGKDGKRTGQYRCVNNVTLCTITEATSSSHTTVGSLQTPMLDQDGEAELPQEANPVILRSKTSLSYSAGTNEVEENPADQDQVLTQLSAVKKTERKLVEQEDEPVKAAKALEAIPTYEKAKVKFGSQQAMDIEQSNYVLSSNVCSTTPESLSQECELPNGCSISAPYDCQDAIATQDQMQSNAGGNSGGLRPSATRCMALPFTSIASLQKQACRAPAFSRKQLTVSASELRHQPGAVTPEIINPCQSSLLPISCVSGNCVARIGDCRTCLHRCADASHKCVAAEEDCRSNTDANAISAGSGDSQLDLDSTMCQIDLPIRCVSSGQCVATASECQNSGTGNSQQSSTNIGSFFSSKCDSSRPLLCSTGQCASRYEECLLKAHNGDGTEYQLQSFDQYQTAFKSPQEYSLIPQSVVEAALASRSSASAAQSPTTFRACSVVCQDGSCRDKQANCPPIWSCPSSASLGKQHRCDQGICSQNSDACSLLLLHTTLASPAVKQCTTGRRCEDGICRLTCLEFFGCPITNTPNHKALPFKCQDGTCAKTKDDCQKNNLCSSIDSGASPYRCRNGQCVKDALTCNQSMPYYDAKVQQIQASVDILQKNQIDFVFDHTHLRLGGLEIPSGSLRAAQNVKNSMQRVLINGVPDSLLKAMLNPIASSRRAELNLRFTQLVDKDGKPNKDGEFLPQAYSLLSPVVQIQNIDEPLTTSADSRLLIQQQFSRASYLTFKMDANHFPIMYDDSKDSCLARKQGGYWVCIGRAGNTTSTEGAEDDGRYVSYPIFQPGVYALILSPQAPLSEDLSPFLFYLEKNAGLFIILSSALGLSLLISLVSFLTILQEKRRQAGLLAKDQGQKQGSLIPDDVLDPKSGVDLDQYIEKLILQLQTVETSRNQSKNEKKAVQKRYLKTNARNQELSARIKTLRERYEAGQQLDDESEATEDDEKAADAKGQEEKGNLKKVNDIAQNGGGTQPEDHVSHDYAINGGRSPRSSDEEEGLEAHKQSLAPAAQIEGRQHRDGGSQNLPTSEQPLGNGTTARNEESKLALPDQTASVQLSLRKRPAQAPAALGSLHWKKRLFKARDVVTPERSGQELLNHVTGSLMEKYSKVISDNKAVMQPNTVHPNYSRAPRGAAGGQINYSIQDSPEEDNSQF